MGRTSDLKNELHNNKDKLAELENKKIDLDHRFEKFEHDQEDEEYL